MGLFNWFFGKKDHPEESGQLGTAQSSSTPPSARRVAERAMVLSTIVQRANLERYHDQGGKDAKDLSDMLLGAIEAAGLSPELEPEEIRLLETPVGEMDKRVVTSGGWRAEGLAVLAWALGRYELPPYDQAIPPRDIFSAEGPLTMDTFFAFSHTPGRDDLRETAVLKPPGEINKFASHITIINWRLRTYRMDPEEAGKAGIDPKRMDFAGYLRAHPRFQETWLKGIKLLDGDLAIRDKPIGKTPYDLVNVCMSIALERHIAAYWLHGDNPIYSKVDPATILMAC